MISGTLDPSVTGTVSKIEKGEWANVELDCSFGPIKISIGQNSKDSPKLDELSEGDYCTFVFSISSKRNDRGFINYTYWFRDVKNFSLEFKRNASLSKKVIDNEDGDEDLPDFLK